MARKKRGGSSGGSGGGEWLNTYADMVTLLLTFFILLYSMSSTDSEKFNMMVKAFSSDTQTADRLILFGVGPENPDLAVNHLPEDFTQEVVNLDEVFLQLVEYIKENQLQDSVQVSQGEGYIFIRFMEDMLFEPNSSRLKTADLEILNFVGMGVKSVQDQVELIRIDGHTAAIPEVPNYPVSDRLLSSDRANAVLTYFEDTIKIDPTKLLSLGHGKQHPIADNNDPVERSKNRRVEIFISSENQIADQINNIYEKLVE